MALNGTPRKKSKQLKIPSHSKDSFTDRESISLIENILARHKRVMPKLESLDKWPNIDGYLEVQDNNGNLLGRLFAQAKTLPVNHKHKFACRVSFFSSCEIDPTMLLGVDNKNKKVYWQYFDSHVVKRIDFKQNQYTKTITFEKNQFFDEKTKDYIVKWEEIVKSNRTKFQDYDALKDIYTILSQSSNKALGKVDQDFVKLHIFLDSLNNLLDREFSTVKNIFYPRAWKISIAYYEYKSSKLSYALYPINLDKNDVQIKEVDQALHDKLQKEGLWFAGHSAENPIETRPEQYAREIIRSKAFKLLENKLLDHAGNEFLAKEFIFAFIDKFHIQLGLPRKETYTLQEIENAFCKHLPLWVEETAKFLVSVNRNGKNKLQDCLTVNRLGGLGVGHPYFDPSIMICEMREEERKKVEDKVKERLKDKKVIIPNGPLGNRGLPFGIFVELFTFLKNTQLKEIKRFYKPIDHSRDGGWIWDLFSKKDVEHNLKTFFENLLSVYETLLKNNFPLLKRELSLFGETNKIIITFSVKEQYKTFQDSPIYKMFYLKAESKRDEQSIEVVVGKAANKFNSFDWEKSIIEHNKKKYDVISIKTSVLDFIYEDTPMLGFIYNVLNDRLKHYFEN